MHNIQRLERQIKMFDMLAELLKKENRILSPETMALLVIAARIEETEDR